MVKAIYQAAKNMQLKTKNIEIVSNNLANINTRGYKRELPFSELMTRFQNSPYKQLTDFSEGSTIATENPLDLAINGVGFFVVEGDNGKELSRDGRFSISEEGYLVNGRGYRVYGSKGEVNLQELLVDKSKTVSFTKSGEIKVGDEVIEKLFIAKIDNQEHLMRSNAQGFRFEEKDTDYQEAEESGYKIMQGYIEESNVDPIREMEAMINVNKDYEATQKVIGAFDTSLGKATEIGRI